MGRAGERRWGKVSFSFRETRRDERASAAQINKSIMMQGNNNNNNKNIDPQPAPESRPTLKCECVCVCV